jgi:hypothetical protein
MHNSITIRLTKSIKSLKNKTDLSLFVINLMHMWPALNHFIFYYVMVIINSFALTYPMKLF